MNSLQIDPRDAAERAADYSEEMEAEEMEAEEAAQEPVRLPEEDPEKTSTEILNDLLGMHAHEGGTVEVHRMLPTGGTKMVGRFPVEGFDPFDVQETFGGGKYQCRLKSADKKYLASQTIEIWGAPKEPTANPLADGLLAQVEKGQAEILGVVEGIKAPQPAEAKDANFLTLALGLLTHVQSMQAPYLEALLSKNTGPSPKDMMDMFVRGMEMAQANAPEGNPYGPVLNTFGPMVTEALKAAQTAPRGEDPGMVHNPPPAPGAPHGPSMAPRPPWSAVVSPFVPHLQRWAAENKDAQFKAQVVVDDLPPGAVPLILEQLGRGEAFLQEFFLSHPETRPFEGWYRAFWEGVAAQYVWEEDEPTEEIQAEGVGGLDPESNPGPALEEAEEMEAEEG